MHAHEEQERSEVYTQRCYLCGDRSRGILCEYCDVQRSVHRVRAEMFWDEA